MRSTIPATGLTRTACTARPLNPSGRRWTTTGGRLLAAPRFSGWSSFEYRAVHRSRCDATAGGARSGARSHGLGAIAPTQRGASTARSYTRAPSLMFGSRLQCQSARWCGTRRVDASSCLRSRSSACAPVSESRAPARSEVHVRLATDRPSAPRSLLILAVASGSLLSALPASSDAKSATGSASTPAWNAAADFQVGVDASNPGPDRFGNRDVWRFLQSPTLEHNSRDYLLLREFNTASESIPGLDCWQPASSSNALPAVCKNARADNPFPLGVNWPAGTLLVHPLPDRLAGVAWRSPGRGTVSVLGRIADRHDTCGDGVDWSVDTGTSSLASGVVVNGGAESFASAEQAANLESVSMAVGDYLYFIVGPGPAHEHSCDSTGLDVTIQPENYSVPGTIKSNGRVSYAVHYRNRATRTLFTTFRLTSLPPHTRVEVTCRGGGCPPGTIRPRSRQTVVLRGLLHHWLNADARVTVRILRPGLRGRALVLTTRRAAGPLAQKLCLARDQRRPIPCSRAS